MSTPSHCTVAEAAKDLGVSVQRMHQLIRYYGVVVNRLTPRFTLIPRKELRKIPKERPSGRRRNKTA